MSFLQMNTTQYNSKLIFFHKPIIVVEACDLTSHKKPAPDVRNVLTYVPMTYLPKRTAWLAYHGLRIA